MGTQELFSVTGSFLKFVGELLADTRKQNLARIDADVLQLKRTVLAEKLQEFTAQLAVAVAQKKAEIEQGCITRGLGNTTILLSKQRAVEQGASAESEKAHCEYNRAIEELALLEKRLTEESCTLWQRIKRRIGWK